MSLENTVKTEEKILFDDLQIAPKILEVLHKEKFVHPTPIQHKAIPVLNSGVDLVGIAQTGTGKTLAFAIPMMQQILEGSQKGKRGLIVVPTRELALQVDETFQKIGRQLGFKTAVLIGGANMGGQIGMLKRNPDVIIGTPGRINDHIKQHNINMERFGVLVLDEADRMFDMGFAPQIKEILKDMPKERQTMLFSATMPDDIAKIATQYMKTPLRVEVARAGTVAAKVEQEFYMVRQPDKMELLQAMLTKFQGSVIVFSRTKFGAKKICKSLNILGHKSAEIHSDRSLFQRREALDGFKKGKYRILIATDIAARGIDVTGIELVLNYDLPENSEDYVHRIGRTGRAGMEGHAVSFVAPDQIMKIRSIERLTQKKHTILRADGSEYVAPVSNPRFAGRKGGGGGNFARGKGNFNPGFSRSFSRGRGNGKTGGRGR